MVFAFVLGGLARAAGGLARPAPPLRVMALRTGRRTRLSGDARVYSQAVVSAPVWGQMARSGPLVDGRCKTKVARRRKGGKRRFNVHCDCSEHGAYGFCQSDFFGLRCSGVSSDGLRRSASRDVARRTAVLRGRTTADRTDAVAGRGCEKTHVVVREGIPGRVINRSRRGRTRNIGNRAR